MAFVRESEPGLECVALQTHKPTLVSSAPLCRERVAKALLLCPRDRFVGQQYLAEAFLDSPVRIEEHDFNVSAPHVRKTTVSVCLRSPHLLESAPHRLCGSCNTDACDVLGGA
jgi:Protein-L-isoaspartate(D-aspartate) O-methyltransferase (PCMT)